MSKKIWLSAGVAAIVGVAGMSGIMGTVNQTSGEAVAETLSSSTDLTISNVDLTSDKDETVYVITDTKGATKKIYTGSSLVTDFSEKKLPVEMSVEYKLNGETVSEAELEGKSGEVEIDLKFSPNMMTKNGKYVPFVLASATNFSANEASNVSVNTGKIIEKDSSYTVIGVAFAGLNEDFGVNDFSNTVKITANVTDFKLGENYAVATNEVFSDIDTSKFGEIDNAVAAVNQLSQAMDTILDGANSLADGVSSLKSGVATLSDGAKKLDNGLNELTENNEALAGGATQTFEGLISNADSKIRVALQPYIDAKIISMPTLTIDNYDSVLDMLIAGLGTKGADTSAISGAKASLDSYNSFYQGLNKYLAGVSEAKDGADQLYAGTASLSAGVDKLADGANELKNGLETFKTDGIDKLTRLANDDLAGFMSNLRATVAASKTYTNYNTSTAEHTRFVFKIQK